MAEMARFYAVFVDYRYNLLYDLDMNGGAFMDSETQEIVEDFKDSMKPDGLALELLKELKQQNDRMDEHNKRLIVTNRILICVVLVMFISFVAYLCMFDKVVVDSDGGYASYIGNDGDINNYGKDSSSPEEIRKSQEDND